MSDEVVCLFFSVSLLDVSSESRLVPNGQRDGLRSTSASSRLSLVKSAAVLI